MPQPFWERKPLDELSREQWESLCDGCGKCCLHKLQDADSGEVFYTDVACRYLDITRARCTDYARRLHNVPACLNLTPANLAEAHWLPESCAYKQLARGNPLPAWHPLLSSAADSVERAGHSVIGRVVSEQAVDEADIEEHVIYWVDE